MSHNANTLPPDIEALLDKLRFRIRFYVWVEGLAALIVLLGVAFWVGLCVDWVFEPSPGFRLVALLFSAGATLYVAYHYILRRVFVRLSNASMANLLERRFERFEDSLVTSVELADHSDHSEPFSEEMLNETSNHALHGVKNLPLSAVFNFRPLLSKSALAIILAVSIITFGVLSAEAFGFWLKRISLAKELWPRSTHLIVEGFEEIEGVRREKVARDGTFELIVKADLSYEKVPELVEIRCRLEDGTRRPETMTRVGQGVPGRDAFQLYRYNFKSISTPLVLEVVGGDARVRDLHLDVVERPQITEMALWCEYPEYMQRSPRELAVTGAMQIPEGTRITLRGKANKELVSVKASGLSDAETLSLELTQDTDRHSFELQLPPLAEHQVLMFRLVDSDAIENLEPYRLAINIAPDEPPQVAIQLQGIGTAITPLARLPVVGTITDDYGIDSVAFEYHVDDGEPQVAKIGREGTRANETEVDTSLDLQKLPEDRRLQPKQRLTLSVRATDFYDLGDSPQIGQSQRFVLQVVSPEQLQLLLQKRELELRRRFETIYADMVDTRDLLARVDFRPPAEPAAKNPFENKTAENEKENSPGDSSESDDATDAPPEYSPERELARRKLRIMRAVQNTQRASHETAAVAEGFDIVYQELVNNRIDTEELKNRLQNEISMPLKRVSVELLPELEKKIRELEKAAADTSAGPDLLRQTTLEADKVLVEMKSILDRMLELEDYNEVLELLRGLIQEQDSLNDKTKALRRQQLRGLLED